MHLKLLPALLHKRREVILDTVLAVVVKPQRAAVINNHKRLPDTVVNKRKHPLVTVSSLPVTVDNQRLANTHHVAVARHNTAVVKRADLNRSDMAVVVARQLVTVVADTVC